MSDQSSSGDEPVADLTETTNNARMGEDIISDNASQAPQHERTSAPTKLGAVPSSYGASGGSGEQVEPTDGEPVEGG